MTDQNPQDLIDALDEVLDVERNAILHGNLDEMAALVERKERLIDDLSRIDAADTALMADLQTKLGRNQHLLDGALQGIRWASERLAEVRKIRRSLETYDKAGKKKVIDGQIAHQLEKRA